MAQFAQTEAAGAAAAAATAGAADGSDGDDGPSTYLLLRGRTRGSGGFLRTLRGPPSVPPREGHMEEGDPPVDYSLSPLSAETSSEAQDRMGVEAMAMVPGVMALQEAGQGVRTYAVSGGAGEGGDVHFNQLAPVPLASEGAAVQYMALSPKGKYLITWARQQRAEGGDQQQQEQENLKVWDTESGQCVGGWPMRVFRQANWPQVQWSADESTAFRIATNVVQVMDAGDLRTMVDRIPQAAGSIAVSPALPGQEADTPTSVAAFVPETSQKPARVMIFRGPHWNEPTAVKTFFRAQEAALEWAPDGSGVLVRSHTDVDSSNTSYYGHSALFLLLADGSGEYTVPPMKEGPIQDVAWAPNGREFLVIAGRMPAQITLYSARRCEAIYDFGQAHRNTIRWSPHGRFLAIAGFGNLAGEIDFWDRIKKKKMSTNSADCTVMSEWSPDGRYFMTATLAPRMNVDNGVRLFKFNGHGPITRIDEDVLLEARWLPVTPGIFPDRPQSPRRAAERLDTPPAAAAASGSEAGGDGAGAAARPAAKPVGVYRPPGARGAGGGSSSFSERLRASREAAAGKSKPSALGARAAAGGRGTGASGVRGGGGVIGGGRGGGAAAGAGRGGAPQRVVGMTPASEQVNRNTAKNQARREKRKQAKVKQQQEQEANAVQAAAAGGNSGDAKQAEPATPVPTTTTAAAAAAAAPAEEPAAPVDPAKRLKKLKKNLRRVEELKQKQAQGETLNEDQLAKLTTEGQLREDIAELEQQVS